MRTTLVTRRRVSTRRLLCVLAIGLLASTAAFAAELTVLCAGAVKPALAALEPAWTARGGGRLNVTYAPAGELLRRLAAREAADLVILPQESLAAVEKEGLAFAATHHDLGSVVIGVAVRQGAPLPDLSGEDGLRRALLDAKSVTFMDPARGTSGRHIDEVVLPKLAIRDAVRAKTVLGEGGMIAEKVARGEVEIAFQQMTELIPVAGITIAGPLPPSLQKTTVYSGAVLSWSKSPAQAAELLALLVSAEGRAAFAARGFGAP